MTSPIPGLAAFGMAVALCTPAVAIQRCELDGKAVNPNNGAETQGKTGLMRCRDADTGELVREQELQNGKSMGLMRYYKSGQLEREFSVNERGNREGVSREWDVTDGKRVLVREESSVNGKTLGVVRTWYPTGQRRRLGFHGDDGEQASVEFIGDGKLYELRCAPRPVFGNEFDDRSACGHGGSVSTVELFNGKGMVASRVSFEHGERRKVETLWDNGGVRDSRETTASDGLERSFAADGTKRRERRWVMVAPTGTGAASATARPRRIDTLDQEFHESGKRVHERRWVAGERGAEIVSESHWYLNGQLKDRSEFVTTDGKRARHDTGFHDNGKPASDGQWALGDAKLARNEAYGTPFGSHKTFDEQGRLRAERIYDDRGRVTREREFDERGAITRDDEVFEDGSRKSAGR